MKKIIFLSILASILMLSSQNNNVNAKDEEHNIFINEICAKNTTIKATDGNYYDWIELYNNSKDDIDLSGYGLSEKKKTPFKYILQEGTVVPSKGYLVIYCDEAQNLIDPSIAAFNLSTSGETVLLTSPDGVTVDSVKFDSLKSDISYGRVPDGTMSFSNLIMSPGKENKNEDILIDMPSFSVEGGFYNQELNLELNCDQKYKIYYTLDGSDPSENDLIYTQPIIIRDKSAEENVLSSTNIKEQTVLDLPIPTYNTTNASTAPNYCVDKATIVKAIAVDDNGNKSPVGVSSYFIDYNNKAKYYSNMKVISLVTDQKNLFDYEKGIYVKGKKYDDWLNSEQYNSQYKYYNTPTNYNCKGSDWERQAAMQIFENGSLVLNQNIGIRIHGAATRAFPQKSFNVYARSMYDASKIKYDFFNKTNISQTDHKIINKYDSIVLRNSGNDAFRLRFRDKLVQSVVSDMDFITQAMDPCILFINGEYWGHYEITEKISADYIQSHYGVDADNVCIIKNNELEEGNDNNLEDFNKLKFWLTSPTLDLTDVSTYNLFCSKIDIDSFIDYMCANIYAGNYDWGNNNFALWKSITKDSTNPYADCKWRFILFDTDTSSNLYEDNTTSPSFNTFQQIRNKSNFLFDLYKKMIKKEEFRNKFYYSFMDMANDKFDSEKMQSHINSMVMDYKDFSLDTFKRFLNIDENQNRILYEKSENSLRYFYDNRFENIIDYMKKDIELEGEIKSVNIENDEVCGSVKLNSVLINEDSWSGQYFTDYPITITSIPNEGHEFSYFQLSDGKRIYTPTAQITLASDITVNIVYDSLIKNTEVIAGNLSLSGNIGVNLYTKIPSEVISDPNAYIQLSVNGKKTQKINAQTLVCDTYNGEECYIISYNLNSNQMEDTVGIQILSGDKVSKPYTTKLNDIISIYMEQPDPDLTIVKPLLKSFSTYGSYSSQYFNKTELTVSEDVKTAISQINSDDMINYKSTITGILPLGLKYYGSTLVLESETAIRHYFILESGKSIDSYSFTMSDNTKLTPVKKDDLYYIEIPNIVASKLGTGYEVKCGDFTLNYSALSYAYSVLKKGNVDVELQDLLKSVYLYYIEADLYLKNN